MGLLDRLAWSRSDPAYDSIASDEVKLSLEAGSQPSHNPLLLEHGHKNYSAHKHWRSAIQYTLLSILTVLLCVVSTAYFRLASRTASVQPLHCGETVTEAEAAGCSFDMLSKAWLHPECPRFGEQEYIDASEDLLNASSWSYWLDPEGSTELSPFQLSQIVENKPGKRWAWAGTDREHIAHCTYIIIRLAEAYNKGTRVDGLTSNFPHTKHCALMMMRKAMYAPDLDKIVTRGDVIMGSC